MELFLLYDIRDIVVNSNNSSNEWKNGIILTCFENWNIIIFCKL